MLIEFKVTNFRSYKVQQTFSMVAGPDNKLQDNTTKTDAFNNHSLLNSAVIYGANASGKSNLVKAMRFVKNLVIAPIDRQPGFLKSIQPFRLDSNSLNNLTEFEIHFIVDNTRFQYGLCLDSQQIHEEWLIAYPKGKPQKWFERKYDRSTKLFTWSFGTKLLGEKVKLQDLTKPDVLFLAVAAAFNNLQLAQVHNWFIHKFQVIVENNITRFNFSNYTALQSMSRPGFSEHIKNLLALADLGIVDFSVKEEDIEEKTNLTSEDTETSNPKKVKLNVTMKHSNSDPYIPETNFNLEDESLGTIRLFSIAGPILDTLERGMTVVIDELDSSLHPILVKYLLKLFHDPELNKLGAQLIFNTHDTTLLDTDVFRRDQIWLVEKDRSGASKLYSLLEFSPRSNEALQKGYLEGRYGGIPFIKDSLLGLAADA